MSAADKLPEGAVPMPERIGEATAKFHSNISGHGWEDPEQLLANPFNHRIHSRRQSKAMVAALEGLGWAGEVRINVNNGHVVDGHLRVAEAISAGEQVPVTYLDLTDEEERAILATYDAIGAMAGLDEMTLAMNVEDLTLPPDLSMVIAEQLGTDDLPDSADGSEGGGDDAPEASLGWGYMTWGKRRMAVSTGEVDLIEGLYQLYMDRNGSEVGFGRWLAETAAAGDDGE